MMLECREIRQQNTRSEFTHYFYTQLETTTSYSIAMRRDAVRHSADWHQLLEKVIIIKKFHIVLNILPYMKF